MDDLQWTIEAAAPPADLAIRITSSWLVFGIWKQREMVSVDGLEPFGKKRVDELIRRPVFCEYGTGFSWKITHFCKAQMCVAHFCVKFAISGLSSIPLN